MDWNTNTWSCRRDGDRGRYVQEWRGVRSGENGAEVFGLSVNEIQVELGSRWLVLGFVEAQGRIFGSRKREA